MSSHVKCEMRMLVDMGHTKDGRSLVLHIPVSLIK